jgi:hypothetical protein
MFHRIPRRLDQEDKFIFGMTGRQTFIMLVGFAFAGIVVSYIDFSSISGFIIGCSVFTSIMLLAAIVAFIRLHYRYIEQYVIVLLAYLVSKRYYLSKPLMIADEFEEPIEKKKEEVEEW